MVRQNTAPDYTEQLGLGLRLGLGSECPMWCFVGSIYKKS